MYSTKYYLFDEIINHSSSYNVFSYHAPWSLNLTGSKIYEDIGTGEKKLSQQEMMIELTHIIVTYCNYGEKI